MFSQACVTHSVQWGGGGGVVKSNASWDRSHGLMGGGAWSDGDKVTPT